LESHVWRGLNESKEGHCKGTVKDQYTADISEEQLTAFLVACQFFVSISACLKLFAI
jgi:hypothetical protein